MDEINEIIGSVLGSTAKKGQSNASSKNNIIFMNPEIYVHNNENTDGSTPTDKDMRIKKLQEELKIKQDQIDLERNNRKLEQWQRHAENVINKKLLCEKDDRIQSLREMIIHRTEIIIEQQALLKQANERIEEMNRMKNGTISNGFQPALNANTFRQTKRPERQTSNRYVHNHSNNANKMQSHPRTGSRPKRKNNFDNDIGQIWEYNGTKWIRKSANNSNSSTQNSKRVTQTVCSEQSKKQKNQDSVHAVTHLQTIVEQTENIEDYSLNASTSTKRNVEMEKTHLSQQIVASEVIVPMCNGPSNISISFDEREIPNHYRHDGNVLQMAKRPKN